LASLLEQFASLGERAKDVIEPVARILEQKASGAVPADLLAPLEEVKQRMNAVLEDAAQIVEKAEAQGWPDVARDAKALRQQVQAALNKVTLAQKNVAARSPS
jgi:hypothetical protein